MGYPYRHVLMGHEKGTIMPHFLVLYLMTWILLITGCRPPGAPSPTTTPSMEVPEKTAKPAPALTGGKPLLMHYMPWYKTAERRGSWGSHWTGHERQHNPDQLKGNGLPDIWSHYHPLIGLYDSTDPDVLECQLLQMKLAGVDGVIADWYGTADIADYREIHDATKALFAACEKIGLWFSACYEDRSIQLHVEWNKLAPDATTNHLAGVFQWMQSNWFEQAHYYRLDNRPLVLNFGPVYMREPAAWQTATAGLPTRPAFFALHHLWRSTGADGGFSWVHYDPWEGQPDRAQIIRRLGEVFTYFTANPEQAIVSAYPGFNDVYAQRHPELDHRNGETLRETLEVAMAGPWPLVQLVTWNDFGEGTMIEPTHEFGYTFLEIIQEARREELGTEFANTPDALRLPARLLALRRTPGMATNRLDQISRMLAQGDAETAALELNELENITQVDTSPP